MTSRHPDPLLHLGEVAVPVPAPDLAGVTRRARAQRRARSRLRAGAGALALVAVIAAGGTVLDRPGSGGQVLDLALGAAPARADSTCDPTVSTGHAAWLDRAQWAPSADGLPALAAQARWPLTAVGVRTETISCPPAAPEAVFLDTDPVRGLTVWSQIAAPYAADAEHVTATTVRGAEALLRDFGGGAFLTWVDGDGVRWLAAGSGMSTEQLTATVDALRLDGTRVVSDPGGFERVTPSGTTRSTRVEWWATYGDPLSTRQTTAQDGTITVSPLDDAGLTLTVTASGAEPPEIAASYWAAGLALADVAGHRAVFLPTDAGAPDRGGWLTWQADGLTYRLDGAVPLADLVATARSVQPVPADDPRVAAAADVDS